MFPDTTLTVSNVIPLLIEATESVANEQDQYNEAYDSYIRLKADLSVEALTQPIFDDEKLPGQKRAAKNEAERKAAIARQLNKSQKMRDKHRALNSAKSSLRLWMAREENYRLIIRALSETVGV